MSVNPFFRAIEVNAKNNRQALINQTRVNEISQPYFHQEVQKKERPETIVKLYHEVKKLAEPLQTIAKPIKDEFISKQLYNRRELVEQGMMNLEDRQATSFNRKIPALTPTKVVKGGKTGRNVEVFLPEGKQISIIPSTRTRRKGGRKILGPMISNEALPSEAELTLA